MTQPLLETKSNQSSNRFTFRTKKELIQHWKMEYRIALKEWQIILLFLLVQYTVFIAANFTIFTQVNTLRREQHAILHDIGLPALSKGTVFAWMHDILCILIVIATILWLVLSTCVRMEQPLFLVIVLKRILMHWSIVLSLCVISSLITTFPTPDQQCHLELYSECSGSNREACLKWQKAMQSPDIPQILYRFDMHNSCQFLTFERDAVFTFGLMLAVIKYASLGHVLPTVIVMGVEVILTSLSIASRKAYSVNAFTTLYVVPMVWFVLDAYVNDINSKDTMTTPEVLNRIYGITENGELTSTSLSSDGGIDQMEKGAHSPAYEATFMYLNEKI
ncbi:unnamed protein product [Albugo candida]|uniref:Sphingomyelin synthase-like domain-containing protein n=1 Tax=Albugo candida TaxID=65357 RepID=A0A024G922_9STRA|nr:unnamed protein product [Albugo candida]|eukprot:CCI42817.1 unnamed protein product [Albugo candida]